MPKRISGDRARSVPDTKKYEYAAKKMKTAPKEIIDAVAVALEKREQKDIDAEREKLIEKKKKEGFEIIDQNHPLVKELKEKIAKAQEAVGRAVEEYERLVELDEDYENSTIASDGIKTINGWGTDIPEGYSRADPRQISEYSTTVLEYEIQKSGGLDYGGVKAEGFPGKRRASDAEKQLIFQKKDEPIGVSRTMCKDCKEFFKREAEKRKTPQVVAEPKGVNIFHDGKMYFIPN